MVCETVQCVHSILVSRLKRGTRGTSRDTFQILSLSRDTLSRDISGGFRQIGCRPKGDDFFPGILSRMSRDTFQNLILSRDSWKDRGYYVPNPLF